MSEDRPEWIRWGILFFLVYLAAYSVGCLTSRVVPWVVTCVLQVLGFLGAPERVTRSVSWGGVFASVAIRFIVVGFTYCWIMGETWKRSGLHAWLAVLALDNLLALPDGGVGMIGRLAASPMFYATTGVACAASFYGARLGSRYRSHEHLREFRERLFHGLVLER
ncbi:MAG: hypothetical protein PHS14_13335 [Elusimicrobia bacterium]|nr:hypothetical protein [Elusimicrobiota bacterium]